MLKQASFLNIAWLLLFLGGCTEGVEQDVIEADTPTQSQRRYFKEYAGPQDKLTLIRDNLYHDDEDELYFDAPYHAEDRSIYLKYEGVPDLIHRPPIHLTNIIDRGSWHHIFDSFYADNDDLYCHHAMSDGGNITRVRGANLITFSLIIANYETNTWREMAVEVFDRAALKKDERAWHITDGISVIGIRCDNQGPLSEWSPELDE